MSTISSLTTAAVRLAGLCLMSGVALMSASYPAVASAPEAARTSHQAQGEPAADLGLPQARGGNSTPLGMMCTMAYGGPADSLRCPLPVYRHIPAR